MNNINNDEKTIDLRKILTIAVNKKKVVIPIIIVCTVIATVIAFVLPKTYQAVSLVRIKGQNTTVSNYGAWAGSLGINIGATSGTPESYIELMKSREVLEPIIAELDLSEEDKAKMKIEDFAKNYLEFVNTKNTDLISISGYGKTPEEAQMISQSVVDNFLALMTKLNREDNSIALKFLNDRITISKEEMETAENKLQAYQQEKGIYVPDEQSRALIEQLNTYDSSIAQLEAQSQANSAKLQDVTNQLQEQNSSLLEYNVSDNDAIMNLRTAIVNKRVELVGLQQRYTEEHPDVIRARQELNELQSSLDKEIQSAVNSQSASLTPVQSSLLLDKVQTETAVAVTNASLDSIKAKRNETETNMSNLSANSIEYIRLLRNRNIATETYTNLVKTYENTRIQEAQEYMGIQVVDNANLPREDMPAKPNKKLIVAIGFVLGIMISLGYTVYVYSRKY